MTITTDQSADRAARATALAAELLKQHQLGEQLPAAAAAIGRSLAVTEARSPHGDVLHRTLQPRPTTARPADERAVLWLIGRGETPTPAAVAARIRNERTTDARAKALYRLAGRHVRQDGQAAARYVADVVAATGSGPTWNELATALGWPLDPRRATAHIVNQLTAAGWLETGTGTRSLRPGPKYTNRAA